MWIYENLLSNRSERLQDCPGMRLCEDVSVWIAIKLVDCTWGWKYAAGVLSSPCIDEIQDDRVSVARGPLSWFRSFSLITVDRYS